MPLVPELLSERQLKPPDSLLWPARLIPHSVLRLWTLRECLVSLQVFVSLVTPVLLFFLVLWLISCAKTTATERYIVNTGFPGFEPSLVVVQGWFVAGTLFAFLGFFAIHCLSVFGQLWMQIPLLRKLKVLGLSRFARKWSEVQNRTWRTYRVFRLVLALVVLGGSSWLSFYLVQLYPKELFSWKYSWGPWMCYTLFLLSLVNFASVIVGVLVSSETVAVWLYAGGDNVDAVEFRFLAQHRTKLEQSYHSELIPSRHTGDETFVYAPLSKVLPKEHLDISSTSARIYPESERLADRFLRCSCCIDLENMVPLRPFDSHSTDRKAVINRKKHERQIIEWVAHLDKLLQTKSECPQERLVDDEADHRKQMHRLCETCKYFTFNLNRTSRRGEWGIHTLLMSYRTRSFRVLEHAPSPRALAESSAKCHLCSIIWHALSSEQQQDLLEHDARIVEEAMSYPKVGQGRRDLVDRELHTKRCIRVAVEDDYELIVHYGGLRRPRRWLKSARGFSDDLFREQLRGKEEARTISLVYSPLGGKYDTVSRNSGSALNIKVIQSWLKGLVYDEEAENWLPTRLLDVAGVDSGIVKLVRREDIDTAFLPRYVALSHCWGEEKFRTYNTATRDEFHHGVSVSTFPRTFQDAVDLTRRLNLRYLWIDSLCILQNDKEDWNREAPTMHRVYMSAYLTLAVVASWDAGEGIYREFDPLPRSRCLVDGCVLGSPDDADVGLESLVVTLQKDDGDADLARNEIRWSRWHTRGWTLQETLLSPRIVYFTSNCVILEAKDVKGGHTMGRRMTPWQLSAWLSSEPSARKFEATPVSNDWHQIWWHWVVQFTHRQLKYPDDRAMAILGLAQYLLSCTAFRKPQQCRYLAGLWEPNLVAGLLWYVHIGIKPRPGAYRGPSWSWISVDGGITNDSLSARFNAGVDVMEIKAIPDQIATGAAPGSNSLAQITPRLAQGSYVQVRGKLRTLTAHSNGPIFYYNHSFGWNEKRHPELISNAALGVIAHVSEQRIGPRCYPLYNDEAEDCVGWFVPDTTEVSEMDVIGALQHNERSANAEKSRIDPTAFTGPMQLHCLLINVEPEKREQRQDFTQPWVMRGIALRRLELQHSASDDDTAMPAFERVGFFELIYNSTGVFAAIDRPFERSALRAEPITDPFGVFKEVRPQSIRIY